MSNSTTESRRKATDDALLGAGHGAHRLFRRFIMVAVLITAIVGVSLISYDVRETSRLTNDTLISNGEIVVGLCQRLKKLEPQLSGEQLIVRASKLTDLPIALVSASGSVLQASSTAIAAAIGSQLEGPPREGRTIRVEEALGEVSGAWLIEAFGDDQLLVVIVPHLPEDEGISPYMTITAGVLFVALAISFFVLLVAADRIVHRPLQRSVDQLVGKLERDIERRRRAEEKAIAARLEAEHHLSLRKNLLDASDSVGIVATDADGLILVFNRGAVAILGYEEAEVVGLKDWDALWSELLADPGESLPLQQFLEIGEDEELVIDAQGQQKLLNCSESQISASGDTPAGRLIIFFDITDERRMAAELKMNELTMIQQSKMASLGEMATGVAHELNQPLNNIGLLASRLSRRLAQLSDADARQFLGERVERMRAQVARASKIIEQLRTFGRPQAVAIEAVVLRIPLTNVLEMLEEQLQQQGIEVEIDIPEEIPPARANTGQLEQVLLNLLTNARDALNEMPDDPRPRRIEVRARFHRHVEHPILLSVIDNGPGMPQSVQERIFQPFFTTKDPGVGTGLGLAISYSLVRGFGGRLRVQSRPGGGTKFTIALRERAKA